MHVAHITSHFASLDYPEVIRGRAIRRIFVAALSHRCNRSRRSRAGFSDRIGASAHEKTAPMILGAASSHARMRVERHPT
jgi:hypothetical protein